MKLKITSMLLLFLALTGCNRTYQHDYLLQHPNLFETELDKCRQSTEYTAYCDMVKQTRDEFIALATTRAEDPEGFGKQILAAQAEQISVKKNINKIKQDYEKMKTTAKPEELKATEEKLNKAKETNAELTQKIKTLLAIVAGTSSPDL